MIRVLVLVKECNINLWKCVFPPSSTSTLPHDLTSHQLFLAVICRVVDAGDDDKSTVAFLLTNFDLDGSGI